MKKFIFLLAIFLLVACSPTQENTPKSVTTAFNAKFANAENVKWELEKAGEWEAEFHQDGRKMSANFTEEGTWLETEIEMTKNDLPEDGLAKITEQYTDYDIKAVEGVETQTFKGFEIEVQKGKHTVEVLLAEDGELTVKKEKGEEDKED
ncbi:MAG: PepSY-like domain-containing protein [Deferribacteres bacterium]|nr:PepSY-like domain-containing protein [Deferribacteres bacterium]